MFQPYEEDVLRQIVNHMTSESLIAKAMRLTGVPFETVLNVSRKVNNQWVTRIESAVTTSLHKGLKKSIDFVNQFHNEEQILQAYSEQGVKIRFVDDVPYLPLEEMDRVADQFKRSNTIGAGVEGALLGAATSLAEGSVLGMVALPSLVAADVALSTAFLSRQVCQVASSYGYYAKDTENLPHLLAAMAPGHQSFEENFLVGKAMAIRTIHQSEQYLLKRAANSLSDDFFANAPHLLRLIQYVMKRMGMLLTEKEMTMMMPVAGAVLNGGVNIAFQHMAHEAAKDYFRLLVLERKYGIKAVEERLHEEMASLKK